MEKETKISIRPGSIVMVILVIAGAYVIWFLRDLILLVLTAIVLASAIRPGVLFFMRYRLPRPLAVLMMYLLVFGAVFVVVYFFLPPILREAGTFLGSLPKYLETIDVPFSSASSLFSGGNSTLSSFLSIQQAFADTSQGAIRLVTTFFGGIFSSVLVVVLSFYFAVQEAGIENFLRIIVPLPQEEYVVSLWRRAQTKIGLWMQGQLMLSVLAGILVYLGLLIIGAPFPLLLGVLTALCEVIPIFGSLFAGAVAVAVTWSTFGVALGFIVAGLFVVVNQFEANLIYPLVVKKIV